MLAGCLENTLLDVENKPLALPREQLDLILGGFVGAEKPVLFIEAAAVYRGVHDIVKPEDGFRTRVAENTLRACARMDIAGEDTVRITENRLRLICENDLRLGTAGADKLAVIFNIIHACEFMLVFAEKLAVFFESEHIAVGIDARFVKLVKDYELIAYLVGGIAEHEDYLFRAHCYAAQTDCKSVAGQDREDDAHSPAAQLGADVLGDIRDSGVVALRPCDDGLGERDYIAVAQTEAFGFCRGEHAVGYDCGKIVPLADNGAPDTP